MSAPCGRFGLTGKVVWVVEGTRTPLVEPYLSNEAFYEALVSRFPMGRVCETDDLVGAAVFFASDPSRFITGQNLLIDGGLTATQ